MRVDDHARSVLRQRPCPGFSLAKNNEKAGTRPKGLETNNKNEYFAESPKPAKVRPPQNGQVAERLKALVSKDYDIYFSSNKNIKYQIVKSFNFSIIYLHTCYTLFLKGGM
jgi:hypothetical protein